MAMVFAFPLCFLFLGIFFPISCPSNKSKKVSPAGIVASQETLLAENVMNALCSLKTLVASFTQRGVDKKGHVFCRQGQLYVDVNQKALRLMYYGDKPMDVLVAKGKMLIYYPGKKESHEYSSNQCPFYFLLEGEKLPQRLKISKVQKDVKNGVTLVVATLVQKKDPLGQKVTLTFSWPNFQLLHWSYEDPSGQGAVVGLHYDPRSTMPPYIFQREKIQNNQNIKKNTKDVKNKTIKQGP